MFDFMIIALAVMVGSLMAGIVATFIVYNKFVMKLITKRMFALSKEVTEELLKVIED